MLGRELHGFVAVLGSDDAIARLLEARRDEQANVLVVVGDQDQGCGNHLWDFIGPNARHLSVASVPRSGDERE